MGIQKNQILYTDGKVYTIEIPATIVRTFSIDGTQCQADRSELTMVDHKGDLVTGSTRPFWYDGQFIKFQSEDDGDEGIFEWSTLGLKFYVNSPGTVVEIEKEEEEKETSISSVLALNSPENIKQKPAFMQLKSNSPSSIA